MTGMEPATFIPIQTVPQTGRFVFDKPGTYAVFFHNISGRMQFVINSRGVNLQIFGLYTGEGSDAFSLETIQLHNSPSSTSNLLIRGVFHDASHFVYEGLIRIEKRAHDSRAYQKNQNIILSEKVFVSSKPNLEILARDVFCTHGSTTGRINQGQLLYLMSRGLPVIQGKRLMAAGFIRGLFGEIEQLGFKKEVLYHKQAALKKYD